MPTKTKGETVVVIDPKLYMQRMLKYRERHQGWHIFRALYWSIYFLIIGVLLIYYAGIGFTPTLFIGSASIIFAVMLILYGLTEALHHKFMQKYG